MLKKSSIFIACAFLAVAAWTSFPHFARADVEWKVVKDLDLKKTPLDIAPSLDGKWLYILTPGEVVIYSFVEGAITDRISVDKDFDRIVSLPRPDSLVVSSSKKKALQVVLLERTYKIDVAGSPFKGPEGAPVTIVVFDDYQCPYCAGLEPLLRQVSESFPKDVKLVIKHFPLAMHSYAKKAAAAAIAAGKQGKFWEMHEKLFANQKDMSDAKVEAIAAELGLNMDQFDKDLKDPSVASFIDKDTNDGVRAGVQGTPTVFIDGKPFNQRSPEGFRQAIEAELKKVHPQSSQNSR